MRLGITLLSSKIIWGHKMQLKGGSDPSKRDSCLLDYELSFGSHCHRRVGMGKQILDDWKERVSKFIKDNSYEDY